MQLDDCQTPTVSLFEPRPEPPFLIPPSPASALPVASLRLLIPPLRLLAAAMWQVAHQQSVKHFGMLEDFVSLVTEAVPQLLTERQRSLLLLALRAKVSERSSLPFFFFSGSGNANENKNAFIYTHIMQICIFRAKAKEKYFNNNAKSK